MSVKLRAVIEQEDPPNLIGMVITNDTGSTVSVVNPDMGTPPPELKWSHSNETFQIAVLQSIGLLKMTMTNSQGKVLVQSGPHPWVTPLLRQRLDVATGESLKLRINLRDHFEVQPGDYHLTVEYGDREAMAQAEADLSFLD